MKTLIMVPTQPELDFLLQACAAADLHTQSAMLGRLPVQYLSELDVTLACGGLGKVQFAAQTQHLLDTCPGWDLVICAGTAGALADELFVGDVVVATETVEHDIRNKFGPPLLPRFSGAEAVVSAFRLVLPESPFQVHFGPMASGDEDVVDTARRRILHRRTGALAVAWEGAGGALACHLSGIPFVEIRGITDRAECTAASDFEANLKGAMGNVATLVLSLLRNLGRTCAVQRLAQPTSSTGDYWQRIGQLAGAETLIIPSAAGAILRDGKVLLVLHNSLKKWQLPGGAQEIGESIEQTVCREIREELGLDLKPRALVGIYSNPRWTIPYFNGFRVQPLIFSFLMEGQIAPIMIQEGEIVEYQFFEPDEIPDETMACCRQKVLDLMAYDGRVFVR